MGTNSAPIVADLLLFCYERDLMLSKQCQVLALGCY